MPERKLTTDQDEPKQIISNDDDRVYQYEVSGADVRLGPNPRSMQSHGVRFRAGDDGTISAPDGLYAEVHPDNSGPAVIDLTAGVEATRNPRRKVERPKDAAARAGESEIVNMDGAGLAAGGSSAEQTIADNTSAGVYKLQTINLAEISGNWSANIRLEIQLEDDSGAVTERMAANIPQLPYNFPYPVLVPESFTVKAVVHNGSASTIDWRINAAYTKEGV